MGTCAAMAASLSSPALSLQGSTIFDSPRLPALTSTGCTSPLRKPTPFALGAAAATPPPPPPTPTPTPTPTPPLPPSAAPAPTAPHAPRAELVAGRIGASATGQLGILAAARAAAGAARLLLHAQEQAREADAAGELAHVERTQSQLWLAVQLAAPVLCALLAGFALGEAIGRPTARGR